jgi:hypothetical protein
MTEYHDEPHAALTTQFETPSYQRGPDTAALLIRGHGKRRQRRPGQLPRFRLNYNPAEQDMAHHRSTHSGDQRYQHRPFFSEEIHQTRFRFPAKRRPVHLPDAVAVVDRLFANHEAMALFAISMSRLQQADIETRTSRRVSPSNRRRGCCLWTGQRTFRNFSEVRALNCSTSLTGLTVSTKTFYHEIVTTEGLVA